VAVIRVLAVAVIITGAVETNRTNQEAAVKAVKVEAGSMRVASGAMVMVVAMDQDLAVLAAVLAAAEVVHIVEVEAAVVNTVAAAAAAPVAVVNTAAVAAAAPVAVVNTAEAAAANTVEAAVASTVAAVNIVALANQVEAS